MANRSKNILGAGILLVSCIATGVQAAPREEPNRPNILVFLMDDMGYGDLQGTNPESKLSLPNLEKMAEQGMVFTDAHSPSAVCAPTRYSVLTGNYPWRGRNENGTWGFNHPSQILPGQETLAHVLNRAGYHNAFFGKMHLGGAVFDKTTGERMTDWKIDFREIDFSRPLGEGLLGMGFDYAYALPNGIQGKPYAFFENDRLVSDPGKLVVWEKGHYGDSDIKASGFGAPDWDSSLAGPKLTEKALAFIDRHMEENKRIGKRRPFYMHYCSEACHTPHSPPDELLGTPVKGASGISDHLDMIYEADVTLGKMVDRLRKAGELNNTLIIFTSDNGGLSWGEAREKGHNSSAMLRGGKAQIWEGGHRVPFIARWGDGTPDGSPIPPGTRNAQLIGLQDIYATLAELTGQSLEKDQGLDSQSFLKALRDPDLPPLRDHLYAQANNEDVPGQRLMKMVRMGDWKLVTTREMKPVALFNLGNDLSEKTNLLTHPEHQVRVQRMTKTLKQLMESERTTKPR
ncbi:MAG: arylsulfatase [Verrucomicrobiota bacterium]|nr:arylsulfatase [Verrucomicrobiota bacterium]